MTSLEAEKVVLTPVDTGQLRALGWRVNHSVTGAEVVADEKRELLDIPLQAGEEVSIDYLIGGRPAVVNYFVLDIKPPDSCVGNTTVVEIRGEEPNNQEGLPVRATLQRNLELLEEDLALATGEGLPAATLVAHAAALRESLQRIF